MHTTYLRKVGGSIMLALPPAILDVLNLSAGSPVGISIDQGRIMIDPPPNLKYTLEELLAQCETDAPVSEEDQAWLSAGRAGGELL